MKVLYVSHKPVYPTVDGGCKAMQQFWKCLDHLNYSITHLCISTEKHPFLLENYPEEIRNKTAIHSVSINVNPRISGAVKSLLSGSSYILNRFENNKIKSQILGLLEETNFGIILFESIFSAAFIEDVRKITSAKLVIRTHNVEFNIWNDLSKNSSGLKRKYLQKLSEDLKKEEIQLLNKADLIFSISEQDSLQFKKLNIKTKVVTIPVAIEESNKNFVPTRNKVSFLGSMNWQPNIEAVEILVNEVLPDLRAKNSETELHLAGSFMKDLFPSDSKKGIINHGFVSDPGTFLVENGIFVAPIQSGSGVKIKILEALSTGTPVVTTLKGAEGIKQNEAILIQDNIENMCVSIEELLSSETRQLELSKIAKDFIHENYSIISVSKLISSELEF